MRKRKEEEGGYRKRVKSRKMFNDRAGSEGGTALLPKTKRKEKERTIDLFFRGLKERIKWMMFRFIRGSSYGRASRAGGCIVRTRCISRTKLNPLPPVSS